MFLLENEFKKIDLVNYMIDNNIDFNLIKSCYRNKNESEKAVMCFKKALMLNEKDILASLCCLNFLAIKTHWEAR